MTDSNFSRMLKVAAETGEAVENPRSFKQGYEAGRKTGLQSGAMIVDLDCLAVMKDVIKLRMFMPETTYKFLDDATQRRLDGLNKYCLDYLERRGKGGAKC